MLVSQSGEGHSLIKRYATNTPPTQSLRANVKVGTHIARPYGVDNFAMCMSMSHDPPIHATLTDGNTSSLLDQHGEALSFEVMEQVAERIRRRIAEMDVNQSDIAKAAGLSSQRFGNYVQGTRTPDIFVLARIARVLGVSTDWLLGLNEAGAVEIKPVVLALLGLEGLPPERAEAIASTVQAALRILAGLPDEGGIALRSRTAALAAWQARHAPEQD